MKIYLCRHGETVLNAEKRWQGRLDSPLTEKGVAESKQVAKYLSDKKIDAIFSSPLGRAKTSALFLRKHFPNAEYFEEAVLKEIDCGKAEGLTFEESKKRYPHLIDRINLKDLNTPLPEGESYKGVIKRLSPFVERIKQDYWKKTVAIVAHGGTNRMLIGILLSLPDKELVEVSTPNDVIYEIDLLSNKSKVNYIKDGVRKKGFVLKS